MRIICGILVALAAFGASGRGEEWVVPQRKASPAATLTNMPLYLEWKWRTDVSDPETGLSNAALKEGVQRIFRAYEDREPRASTRRAGRTERRSSSTMRTGPTPCRTAWRSRRSAGGCAANERLVTRPCFRPSDEGMRS